MVDRQQLGMSPGPGNQLTTKDDLREVQVDLRDRIREGFDGVHKRQDVTNGRVGKAEISLGEHGVRLANMEREVFRRRRTDRSNTTIMSFDRHSISLRDLRMFTTGILLVVGIIIFLSKISPAIMKVIFP